VLLGERRNYNLDFSKVGIIDSWIVPSCGSSDALFDKERGTNLGKQEIRVDRLTASEYCKPR
jgi:hypothetical protein